MKCKNVRRYIYVYHELAHHERSSIREHIDGCADCEAFFQQQQDYRKIISEFGRSSKAFISDPTLAHRIFALIRFKPTDLSQGQANSFFASLDRAFIRHSLAAASLFLIGLFLSEINRFGSMPDFMPNENRTENRIENPGYLNVKGIIEKLARERLLIKNVDPVFPPSDCLIACREGNYNFCKKCLQVYLKIQRYESIDKN